MTLFSVQPDAAAGVDVKLLSSQPIRNYGVSTTIISASTERGLLYFSLASIPAGSTCDDATLYLYRSNQLAALAFTLTIYPIAAGNAGWIEGTKNNTTAGAGEPCWNAKEADGLGGVTTAWAGSAGASTPTTDFGAAIGTVNGDRGDAIGTEYAIVLDTTAVAAMFGDAANYGFLLSANAAMGNIDSSDGATAGYRPKLVINWTAAGGGDPEGSLIGGKLLRGGLLTHGVLVRG